MSVHTFASELEKLRAFRDEHVGSGLLEALESSRLLLPRIRIHYPDPIARRFWLEIHEGTPYQLKHPVEPDGARWDAVVDFVKAFDRWQNSIIYGPSPNPLEDIDPRFAEFIEHPEAAPFEPWQNMRVDVSNDIHGTLFADCSVESYYTTWQLLLAVEVANAGIHFRMNLTDKDIGKLVEQLSQGNAPDSRYSMDFSAVHAARDFAKHENALNAVVWFAEERSRALDDILKNQGGRFRMSDAQMMRYGQATDHVASTSMQRHHISPQDLTDAVRYLAGRWSDWHREDRPRITNAYKEFLAATLVLAQRYDKLTFAELRDRIGKVGGWFEPILDVIWPNWTEQEKKRVRHTLKAALTPDKSDSIADSDIDSFVEFLSNEGLEAFFWRLKSFEDHALRGNEFAREGMKSDLQGMAVAVEHVAVALGATKTQLYEKFKQLWHAPDVIAILKRSDVSPLARQERLARDWPALKSKIEALRAEKGGRIAADLVMAHRIRGGVHATLPEHDQLELEALFVGLMRAAVHTFVEVRRRIAPQLFAPLATTAAIAEPVTQVQDAQQTRLSEADQPPRADSRSDTSFESYRIGGA